MARAADPSGSRTGARERRDDGQADDAPAATLDLDARIDSLYQLPLDEFTEARNALAKSLSGAGDKAAAATVKALAKPTVIPWAVNQVYWQARSIWTRLMEAGEELRAAQVRALERPGTTSTQVQRVRDDLRDATAAHRQAVADAVHQAVRAAAQAKVNPQTDLLARMLDAVSLAAAPDHPGRFTEVIQPAGFEALFGVSPVALPSASARAAASPDVRTPDSTARPTAGHGKAKDKRTSSSAREAAAHAAAERQRAQELRAATDALAEARAAERTAQDAAESARADLDDAELRVTQARAALKTAEAAVKTAAAARSSAEAVLHRLDKRK